MVLSLYITLHISVVSQKTLFILTYWKLYTLRLYHLVHPFSCPGNKCLLCSFSLKSELENYFENAMKPRKFPSSSTVVTGPSPLLKFSVAPPPANTKQSFLPTLPSLDQAQAQHLTKVHRSGSSMEAEQNAKKREPRRTCIFLSPVPYLLFAPGHEVCIRPSILEERGCHGKWQSKAKLMKQGLSSRAQKRVE